MILTDETVKRLDQTIEPGSELFLKPGDVLVQRSNTGDLVGTAAIFDGPAGVYIYPDLMMRIRFRDQTSAHWFWRYANSTRGRRFFQSIAAGSSGSMPKISGANLRSMPIPLPQPAEQRAIAEALSDVDRLLGALEAVIVKKRAIKHGVMQQLLTGRTRLPGFKGEWERKQIRDVARPSGHRNTSSSDLPVLACSKHLGFVDSLGYFKNRVFSKDLNGYKLIRRGEIGYPANHVEEGSIGLQDLYDVALVSPIYVVFTPTEGVESHFLHRLLKLEQYRQAFAAITNSSVDRRGSLRWPQFSEISVTMPSSEEQAAIAGSLTAVEGEIAALEAQHEKTHAIKQGMMQQLLRGRVRLIKPQHREPTA
jgi:type I restriction enzyme S subunit